MPCLSSCTACAKVRGKSVHQLAHPHLKDFRRLGMSPSKQLPRISVHCGAVAAYAGRRVEQQCTDGVQQAPTNRAPRKIDVWRCPSETPCIAASVARKVSRSRRQSSVIRSATDARKNLISSRVPDRKESKQSVPVGVLSFELERSCKIGSPVLAIDTLNHGLGRKRTRLLVAFEHSCLERPVVCVLTCGSGIHHLPSRTCWGMRYPPASLGNDRGYLVIDGNVLRHHS